MSHFRSETMKLYQLTVPKDDVWNIANVLGASSCAHFIDLNKNEQPFDLPYTLRIKMCDDAERRLVFLIQECKDNRIRVNKPHNQENFEDLIRVIKQEKNVAIDLLFDSLDTEIIELEKFVAGQSKAIREMQESLYRKEDFLKVLQFVQGMVPTLGGAQPALKAVGAAQDEMEAPLVSAIGGLTFVAGTILTKQEDYMRRIIFRVTRGKALTHFESYEQLDGELKSTYMVVYQESSFLSERIQKICDSFQAGQRFNIPPIDRINAQLLETKDEIQKDQSLTKNSQIALKSYLRKVNQLDTEAHVEPAKAVNTLEVYRWFIAKEKSIYNALNMMRAGQSTYIGYFWSPEFKQAQIHTRLGEYPSTDLKEVANDFKIKEPTCFESNDVTRIYQLITDTYGVPAYKEANPSVFNIITFPFLFGVMFGDYGHGSLLLLCGTLLVLSEPWLRHHDTMKHIVPFRYFLFLMGTFSCWNGLLYNEYFAIPNAWATSCYDTVNSRTADELNNGGYYNQPNFDTCNYAFGIDPAQFLSNNYLEYIDNVKMKTSVIIAVFHMSMGIIIKGSNAIHFRNWMVLVFEVITGFIILFGLFGWMDVLIFSKWFFVMNPNPQGNAVQQAAMTQRISTCPSIITVMIDNFLKLGFGMSNGPYFFNHQNEASAIMIICAVICMPLMLCVKPIAYSTCLKEDHAVEQEFNDQEEDQEQIMAENRQQQLVNYSRGSQVLDNVVVIKDILNKEGAPEESHAFGEMMIHQMIETIEFVLGTVSNTASYLRLWALSLAHSELALVFLTEILIIPWQPTKTVVDSDDSSQWVQEYNSEISIALSTWILWFPFMTFTYFVLLNMDVLECSLHTLRLHWVEFQNKFFMGTGYAYTPFSFNSVFEKEMAR